MKQSLSVFYNKHEKFFTILNCCVPFLLCIYIFCLPFPYTTAITNFSFYLAILTAMILLLFKPDSFTFKTPFTYPFIAFFLWSLMSIFWTLNVENTINDVRGHLFYYIIFYFLLINFFHSKKRIEILGWIIVSSAATFSVLGMIYYYIIMDNPVQLIRFGGITSTNKNISTELPVNMIGTLNITAIFFCLHFFGKASFLYQRITIVFCLLGLFLAIIMTHCRGTFVALVIAVSALLLIKQKKLVPVFLIAIAFLFFSIPFEDKLKNLSFAERLKINYVSYQVWKDYPLKGIGFGMMTFPTRIDKKAYIKKLPEKYRPEQIVGPHNLLLDITVRLGVIGLMLFLIILLIFVKICCKTIRQAKDAEIRHLGICVALAFLAYFVIGLAEPLFLFTVSAVIFYILLAMIMILSQLNENDTKNIEF